MNPTLRCTAFALIAVAAVLLAADPADDIAFRRVLLRGDQVAAEIERAQNGVWRQLPVEQFDDLVRRASQPTPERPRLLETTYRARLDGESLIGSAAWTVRHTHDAPTLLPVDPMQLAVRRVAWSDNGRAVLGELDARAKAAGLELLVDRAGDRTLNLDWSLRGVAEPAGLRFDLRVPSCAIAVLELDLPADLEPAVGRDGAVLTGLLSPTVDGRQFWRVAFGSLSHLDIVVRPRVPSPDAAPLVFTRQRNRCDLSPGSAGYEYVVEFEALRTPVHELALECDVGFRLTNVAGRNIRGWEICAGATPATMRVAVALAEPTPGGAITLRGTGAVAANGAWTCPAVRVVGATSRGETLALRLAPDLRPAEWRAGSFRIVDAAVADDRSYSIGLQSASTKADGARPSARLSVGSAEYAVRQRAWWHVAAERSTLKVEVTLVVARGQVERVPVVLPTGWDVERLEFAGDDRGPLWALAPDRASLVLSWARPWGIGEVPKVTVTLGRRTDARGGQLAFPDVVVVGARSRTGTLAVRVEPDLESSFRGPAMVALPADATAAPWGANAFTAAYALTRTPLDGVLLYSPVAPRFRTTATTRIDVAGRTAHVVHELRVEPTKGAPDALLVFVPSHGREPWNWQVVRGPNRIRNVTRLAVGAPPTSWLTAGCEWNAVALAGAVDPAGWWKLTLEHPLLEPVVLRAAVDLTLPADAGQQIAAGCAAFAGQGGLSSLLASLDFGTAPTWNAPLVTTLAADRETHTVHLTLRSPRWQVATTALTEVATAESSPVHRTFRGDGPAARLVLLPTAHDRPLIDGVRMTSTLQLGASCSHELGFRVWRQAADGVVVRLPFGSIIRAVRVDGFEVRSEFDLESRLRIPVPFGPRVAQVDVRFATSQPGWRFCTTLRTPSLELAGEALSVETVWRLPSGVEPLSPASDGTLVVVRPVVWSLTGFAVAVAAYLACRSCRSRWPWAVALAVSAFAAILLPTAIADLGRWPFYAVVMAVGVSLVRRPTPVVAGVLVAVGWSVGGNAAGPTVPTVYLVPAVDGGEPRSVLAPPELLDRLNARARVGALADYVVPVEAAYDGRVAGTSAEIRATLAIEAGGDGVLTLPFAGALLRKATLDGKAAFPRTVGDRLTLAIAGRGRHQLELEFVVPCPTGEDREVRFAVAETPVCSLALRLPNAARFVQTLSRRGDQRFVDVAGARRLEVDCGRVNALAVRWRQESPTTAAPSLAVRESYLWDLQPTAAKLLGALRYEIGGSVAALSVDVPPGLEVTAVAARPLETATANPSAAWLKSWAVVKTDGGRRLQLDFAAPVSGNWLVALEFVPAQPFAASFALTFPSPVGTTAAGPTAVAWRARDFAPQVARLIGLTPMSDEEFLRDHWTPARVEPDPRPPTRAFRRNMAGMATLLRLTVRPDDAPRADVRVDWPVGPRRADVAFAAHVTTSHGKVALLEADVPLAVEVTDVTGPEVDGWTRSGQRVQVWLRRGVDVADVTLAGSIKRAEGAVRFEAPVIRLANLAAAGVLRVNADDGWALTPILAQSIEAAGETGGGRGYEYRLTSPTYRAAFQLRSAVGATDFQLASSLERDGRRATLAARITAPVRRGELRSFVLTAADAEGWDVAFELPRGAKSRELSGENRRRRWQIDLPNGVNREAAIDVRARRDLTAEFAVPEFAVRVPDGRTNRVDRSLALDGELWRVVRSDGWVLSTGGVWNAAADAPRLMVAPAEDGTGVPFAVERAGVEVGRPVNGNTMSRESLTVRCAAPDELRLKWPVAIHVRSAARDGLILPTPEGATRELRFSLAAGTNALNVVWETPTGDSTANIGPAITHRGESVIAARRALPARGSAMPFDDAFAAPAAANGVGRLSRLTLALRGLVAALLLTFGCLYRPTSWPAAWMLLGVGLAVVAGTWLALVPLVAAALGGASRWIARRPSVAVSAEPFVGDGN